MRALERGPADVPEHHVTIASPYLRAELARFSRAFKLTPREHDVLFLLVSGYGTVPEIARHLSLSGNTVHNHFKNIFRRTRTNTKPALLSLFLQQTLERYAASALLARRPRVLLVDGNNAECERLCRGLRSYGFEASSEGLTERVAERVADERIDIVIADGTTKIRCDIQNTHARRMPRGVPDFEYNVSQSQDLAVM